MTVTANEHEYTSPGRAALAMQVTFDVPIPNVVPGGGTQTTVTGARPPDGVGTGYMMTVPSSLEADTVTSAGQRMYTGGSGLGSCGAVVAPPQEFDNVAANAMLKASRRVRGLHRCIAQIVAPSYCSVLAQGTCDAVVRVIRVQPHGCGPRARHSEDNAEH